MKKIILQIQQQIKEGLFPNEASVIRGIINPILQELNWPVNDVRVVRPEYTISTQRVDIALFHNNQPLIFLEAKKIGGADGAEKQLFEYAFHSGVPILILTDGPTWHFFLTAGIGSYEQRKVNKLDLLEYDDLDQLCTKFHDYLDYNKVISGKSKQVLEEDYKSIYREREIVSTLPNAWLKILEEEDEILFEILANKVEELCNYKPSKDLIIKFLSDISSSRKEIKLTLPPIAPIGKVRVKPSGSLGFTRILKCRFGDKAPGTRWANLITTGIELAIQRGCTLSDLQKNTTMNLLSGEEHERGFKYVPKAKISYQGMDANKTWENALKLAQLINEEIYVEFEWSNNPNAVHPNKKETLFWKP